jgi:hypothetical protein
MIPAGVAGGSNFPEFFGWSGRSSALNRRQDRDVSVTRWIASTRHPEPVDPVSFHLSAMRPPLVLLSRLLAFACLNAAADPVITEICASNQSGLRDEDGDRPDWVEIHNPDPTPADLSNWYLTDNTGNKTKWRFPTTSIAPGGYLVVFASGKDRRVAGQPLHANFSLSADGEYLGLIRANGVTVASHFSPGFPPQFADLSYGLPSNVVATTLVGEGDACQWIVPTSATNPPSAWRDLGFTASAWNAANQGIGYDRNTAGVNFLPELGSGGNTESAMHNIRTTCYLRIPFTVPAGAVLGNLTLRVKYDDGFIAWLNGQPLLSGGTQVRRRTPDPVLWNSAATGNREDSAAMIYEDIQVDESIGQLVEGQNVLAFQILNQTLNSSDLLFRATLTGEAGGSGPAPGLGFFPVPTPGVRNPGVASTVIPQPVAFSRAAGTFSTNFNLSLSGAIAGQQIRYTTDGSTPGPSSAIYGGPFQINTSMVVRARIYHPTSGALGFTGAAHYEKLDPTLANYQSTGSAFRSSLPIVVINNRGLGELPNNNLAQSARVQVYDRDASGYASISTASAPALAMNTGIKLRGRSSSGFPKKSYGFELFDESGQEADVEVLGMPAGSDWALVGCYDFDRAFMRNAWIYEMSRQAGRWAPRTRLVEVYFNQDGDTLEFADYRGVYVLCETIRRGPDRVDVAGLDAADTVLPEVSGGYIFKVDPPESDEFSWKTARNLPPASTGGDNLVIHRPKLADLAGPQSAYLVSHFQAFEDTLYTEAAGGFATRNYRGYIDSEAWADHNLFGTLAKNVDALRLSAYFHKERGAPMVAGPLWDFDRSVNSTDSRDNDPNSWHGSGFETNGSTDFFRFAWWQKLFEDVEFRQTWVDRWQRLRRDTLSTANVNSVLDGFLAEFKAGDADHPARRDYQRWYGSAVSNNIVTETGIMKAWLSARSAWIDSQFTRQPVIVRPPGPVAAGLTTTLSVPPGTTVYYTTDGSDPRAVGGGFAPGALAYNGTPVAIPSSMILRARAWRSGSFAVPATNWSGPVEALYLVDESYATAADLRVTGIHYNPLGPSAAESAAMPELTAGDFEWLELTNVAATPVNLDGVTLAEGSPVDPLVLAPFTLSPGAKALVVKNAAAFELRYGPVAAARIAGTWTGGSLDNSGESIAVLDRNGGSIAVFAYDDEGDWPERADGSGSALEYVGSSGFSGDYENPMLWNSSEAVHGSPGGANPFPASAVVVNEILASPAAGGLDGIELHNTGATPVDLGGWYLSNVASAASEEDYKQFRIPDGTVLPVGGFLVFDEEDFNPNGAWNPSPGSVGEGEFSLDGDRGGALWLISADPVSGKPRTFEQKADWSPLLAGIPYGRSPDGGGSLAPLASWTPAAANAAPRVGPVQVTEIHYHPASGTPEFVEISNTGPSVEPLGNWTLRGDVDFDFAAAESLAPAEAVVMVAFDPVLLPAAAASFRAQYGVAAEVRLIGPWSAADTLGDTSGTVRLRRRVPAPPEEPGFIGLMVEDEVPYLAGAPWPGSASGSGSSIRRVGVRRQGSDPAAWIAAAPGPGSGVGGYTAWSLATFGAGGGGGSNGDPDFDGLENVVEYLLGSDARVFTALASGVDSGGPAPRFVLDYSVRLDRDDGILKACQSDALGSWSPAENDGPLSSDGLIEQRRAWLPLATKGFLRLEAEATP